MSSISNLMAYGSNDEDYWDDTELIKAYEDAVKFKELLKANGISDTEAIEESKPPGPWEQVTEVASQHNGPTVLTTANSASSLGALRQKNKGTIQNWKLGSKCRAIYSVDNIEYEADIVELAEDESSAIVKFIGYENEELVEAVNLLKSHGKNTRERQKREAAAYNATGQVNELAHLDSAMELMGLNACQYVPSDLEKSQDSEVRNSSFGNDFQTSERHQEVLTNICPDDYVTSSNAKKPQAPPLSNISYPKMFAPPLPTSMTNQGHQHEGGKGDIPSLLMAWYMAGYHAGYFDAKQDSKKTIRDKRTRGS